MDKSQRIWMWVAVAVSFLVGLLLVWNDSAPGWFLIIMGAVYLGMLSRPGQGLASSNPGLVRWGSSASRFCSSCSQSGLAQWPY